MLCSISSGEFVDGKFGWDIAFASDANSPTILVGQKSDDSGNNRGRSGQVRVFRWNKDKGTFRQIGEPVLGDSAGDSFGRQVAINADGKIFAAGSRYADGVGGRDVGAAQTFENIGGGDWINLNANIEGENADDQFFNVAMNAAGNRIAVGGGSGVSSCVRWTLCKFLSLQTYLTLSMSSILPSITTNMSSKHTGWPTGIRQNL